MATIWLNCDLENLQSILPDKIQNSDITGVMLPFSKDVDIDAIKFGCDLLMDKYDDGEDGFVCLKLDPHLANDTKKLISMAKELSSSVDEDNFMVGIPATTEGIEAIKELATCDINICATHIFSPNQASQSAQAMREMSRSTEGVISVSVSPFDEMLNASLAVNNLSKDRIGFFNAIKIYNQIVQMGLSNVKVLFDELTIHQPWLDENYYIEQLNLHNAILNLPRNLIEAIDIEDLTPSFEFQTKHIDAFFSYLTLANISLQSTYETLLTQSIQKDIELLEKKS